jgi:hypothetical protein
MDAEHEPNLEGLKKLEEGMRRLEKERVLVPGKLDDDLLGAVRQHFVNEGIAEIRPVAENEILFPAKHAKGKRRKSGGNWQKWLPLAASIAIAAIMVEFARQGRIAQGDVNRDGVVDVVDAFALAERVASGERTSRRWDVNGDGKVDAGDSNAILERVVDLERSRS